MYFHCWTSNLHVDLFEGYFCNEMCFIIKPEAFLSLFFPQMKGAFFVVVVFLKTEAATPSEAIQWQDRRSTQAYVRVKCGLTFLEYTWYFLNRM